LSETPNNKVDIYAAERIYEEQELGARFDPETGKRRYDKYEVVKVKPTSDQQLQVLRFLEKGKLNTNSLEVNLLEDSLSVHYFCGLSTTKRTRSSSKSSELEIWLGVGKK